MRLSTAIALGRTLVKPDPFSYCNCAIGMGLAATGTTYKREEASLHAYYQAIKQWPWLVGAGMPIPVWLLGKPFTAPRFQKIIPLSIINMAFSMVCHSELTLETLIDWVRSVEPAEETETQIQKTEVNLEHVPV